MELYFHSTRITEKHLRKEQSNENNEFQYLSKITENRVKNKNISMEYFKNR